MLLSRLTAIAVLSAALAACGSSTQSLPVAATAANASSAPTTMEIWHRAIAHSKLPSAGCFTAKYPSAAWSRVACGTPPNVPFPALRSRRLQMGQVVGGGNDFTAYVAPQVISTAIGAFPMVQGVKREISRGARNKYSLQLNSNFFQTKACGTLPNCLGWSQFAYVNTRGTRNGRLFIQDWLLNFDSGFAACPPKGGWTYYGGDCYRNSRYGVRTPNIDITQLGSVALTGVAAPSGDGVYLIVGSAAYGMKKVQKDGITDLSENWQGAEFNVVGGGGGDQAQFNPGSTITVSLQVDDGVATAPQCPAESGTTGETNNLNFVTAPASPQQYQYPSIEFTMSSNPSGTPTCDTSNGTE